MTALLRDAAASAGTAPVQARERVAAIQKVISELRVLAQAQLELSAAASPPTAAPSAPEVRALLEAAERFERRGMPVTALMFRNEAFVIEHGVTLEEGN